MAGIWLRNYDNFRSYPIVGQRWNGYAVEGSNTLMALNGWTSLNYLNLTSLRLGTWTTYSNSTDGYCFLIFGNGNSAPTYDDHALSGSTVLTYLSVTGSTYYNSETGNYEVTAVEKASNDSQTDSVYVSEFGIAVSCTSYGSPTSSLERVALIYKETLDSAIEVPPGNYLNFTLKLIYPATSNA